MTFALPAAGRYVLKQARVLGRMLPKPIPPVDFDGFAIVDILVDEGVIAKIVPAGVDDFGEDARSRNVGAHRAAALRRRAHPSRQGAYLATETKPGRGFSERGRGDGRGPFRQLERRRRRRAHGVQPALRLRARDDGHSHPYRQRRPTDENQLAGPGRSARALARADRPPGVAALHHRPYGERLAHGRHRSDARRLWVGDSRRRHPHGAGSA